MSNTAAHELITLAEPAMELRRPARQVGRQLRIDTLDFRDYLERETEA